MFDITSSKLLILAIVALIVVGPKDLPILLRTVGKYLGVMRRHANEFRAQFDEVIREAELQDLKKEIEQVSKEVKSTMDEGVRAIDQEAAAAKRSVESVIEDAPMDQQQAPAKLEPMAQEETETEAETAAKTATAAAEPPTSSEKTGT